MDKLVKSAQQDSGVFTSGMMKGKDDDSINERAESITPEKGITIVTADPETLEAEVAAEAMASVKTVPKKRARKPKTTIHTSDVDISDRKANPGTYFQVTMASHMLPAGANIIKFVKTRSQYRVKRGFTRYTVTYGVTK